MKTKLITSFLLISSFSAYATSVAVFDEEFKVADLPVNSKLYTVTVTRLEVPQGLVVLGYTAPNLQGTHKSYSVGSYENLKISSLKITDQEDKAIGSNTIKIIFNPRAPGQMIDLAVCGVAFFYTKNTESIEKKICANQPVYLDIDPADYANGDEITFGVKVEHRNNIMSLGTARVAVNDGLFYYVKGSHFPVTGSEFIVNGDGSYTFKNYNIVQYRPYL